MKAGINIGRYGVKVNVSRAWHRLYSQVITGEGWTTRVIWAGCLMVMLERLPKSPVVVSADLRIGRISVAAYGNLARLKPNVYRCEDDCVVSAGPFRLWIGRAPLKHSA